MRRKVTEKDLHQRYKLQERLQSRTLQPINIEDFGIPDIDEESTEDRLCEKCGSPTHMQLRYCDECLQSDK